MAFVELNVRTMSYDKAVYTERMWLNTDHIIFVQVGSPLEPQNERLCAIWTVHGSSPLIIGEHVSTVLQWIQEADQRWYGKDPT